MVNSELLCCTWKPTFILVLVISTRRCQVPYNTTNVFIARKIARKGILTFLCHRVYAVYLLMFPDLITSIRKLISKLPSKMCEKGDWLSNQFRGNYLNAMFHELYRKRITIYNFRVCAATCGCTFTSSISPCCRHCIVSSMLAYKTLGRGPSQGRHLHQNQFEYFFNDTVSVDFWQRLWE